MEELCKRCLLYEAGERAAYTQVQAYLETVPPEELASPTVRNSRLSQCRHCDQLIAGMCRKCGCYVEVRAALKQRAECGDERRLERIQVGFFYGLIV